MRALVSVEVGIRDATARDLKTRTIESYNVVADGLNEDASGLTPEVRRFCASATTIPGWSGVGARRRSGGPYGRPLRSRRPKRCNSGSPICVPTAGLYG